MAMSSAFLKRPAKTSPQTPRSDKYLRFPSGCSPAVAGRRRSGRKPLPPPPIPRKTLLGTRKRREEGVSADVLERRKTGLQDGTTVSFQYKYQRPCWACDYSNAACPPRGRHVCTAGSPSGYRDPPWAATRLRELYLKAAQAAALQGEPQTPPGDNGSKNGFAQAVGD